MKSSRKWQLTAVALISLAALAALHFRNSHSNSEDAKAIPSAARPVDDADGKFEETKAASANGRDTKGVAAPKPAGWAGVEFYVAYERARNLADVIDNLKAAADGGDPNAQGMYAWALTECSLLSTDPYLLGDVPRRNEVLKKQGRALIPDFVVKRYAERCQQLVSSGRVSIAEIKTMQHNAESGGDPFSSAIHFAEIAPGLSAEDRKQGILSILQSRNPYAINVLSELMGQPSAGDGSGYGNFAGSDYAKYAWQFVACDLGMDCSNSGPFATRMCLRYYLCGNGNYKSIVETSALSPEAYLQAMELERRILVAFQTGDLGGVVFGPTN